MNILKCLIILGGLALVLATPLGPRHGHDRVVPVPKSGNVAIEYQYCPTSYFILPGKPEYKCIKFGNQECFLNAYIMDLNPEEVRFFSQCATKSFKNLAHFTNVPDIEKIMRELSHIHTNDTLYHEYVAHLDRIPSPTEIPERNIYLSKHAPKILQVIANAADTSVTLEFPHFYDFLNKIKMPYYNSITLPLIELFVQTITDTPLSLRNGVFLNVLLMFKLEVRDIVEYCHFRAEDKCVMMYDGIHKSFITRPYNFNVTRDDIKPKRDYRGIEMPNGICTAHDCVQSRFRSMYQTAAECMNFQQRQDPKYFAYPDTLTRVIDWRHRIDDCVGGCDLLNTCDSKCDLTAPLAMIKSIQFLANSLDANKHALMELDLFRGVLKNCSLQDAIMTTTTRTYSSVQSVSIVQTTTPIPASRWRNSRPNDLNGQSTTTTTTTTHRPNTTPATPATPTTPRAYTTYRPRSPVTPTTAMARRPASAPISTTPAEPEIIMEKDDIVAVQYADATRSNTTVYIVQRSILHQIPNINARMFEFMQNVQNSSQVEWENNMGNNFFHVYSYTANFNVLAEYCNQRKEDRDLCNFIQQSIRNPRSSHGHTSLSSQTPNNNNIATTPIPTPTRSSFAAGMLPIPPTTNSQIPMPSVNIIELSEEILDQESDDDEDTHLIPRQDTLNYRDRDLKTFANDLNIRIDDQDFEANITNGLELANTIILYTQHRLFWKLTDKHNKTFLLAPDEDRCKNMYIAMSVSQESRTVCGLHATAHPLYNVLQMAQLNDSSIVSRLPMTHVLNVNHISICFREMRLFLSPITVGDVEVPLLDVIEFVLQVVTAYTQLNIRIMNCAEVPALSKTVNLIVALGHFETPNTYGYFDHDGFIMLDPINTKPNDFPKVFLHEFMHFLGFDHSAIVFSVMFNHPNLFLPALLYKTDVYNLGTMYGFDTHDTLLPAVDTKNLLNAFTSIRKKRSTPTTRTYTRRHQPNPTTSDASTPRPRYTRRQQTRQNSKRQYRNIFAQSQIPQYANTEMARRSWAPLRPLVDTQFKPFHVDEQEPPSVYIYPEGLPRIYG